MISSTLQPHNCPVCKAQAKALDVVDFNKNCEEKTGVFLPLSGKTVYYYHCPNCAFTFAPELMAWSKEEFEKNIYNEEYGIVDPDYLEARPANNAKAIYDTFGQYYQGARHLDYGGGNGLMSKIMREKGWNSTSYDPFVNTDVNPADLGKFDFITAFEIFEHVSDVNHLIKSLTQLMHPQSVVLFSTLISDTDIKPNQRLNWWYASPRNGHISLFSKKSLALLASSVNLKCGSFNNVAHYLYFNKPEWAPH
ncbi:MAG: class I SAM-dependent methyltransferase [Alphaproteobacteria bacterium]|nr:class I SAM-dependent methyltransferase [Alphaproteobacteria bacterium]